MEGKPVELEVIKSEPESEMLGMEGKPVKLEVIKSEPESEMLEPCKDRSVKEEPGDDTDPGGDPLALPMEGTMFEFHAVESEEHPRLAIPLAQLAGVDDPLMEPALEKDPLDVEPETAQTGSPNDKSLVGVSIPTDYIEIIAEEECPTQSACRLDWPEYLPQELSAPVHGSFRSRHPSRRNPIPSVAASTSDRDRLDSRSNPRANSNVTTHVVESTSAKTLRKRQPYRRSSVAEVRRKFEDVGDAKLELVELQLSIAKNKLKRTKGSSSIEKAEASLRRTEHEIKLQTLKDKYKRQLEKEKLKAEILRIDMEIEKCMYLKKRAQRDSSQ